MNVSNKIIVKLVLFLLLPTTFAAAKSLHEEWDDVTRVLPQLVHQRVASELKAEFSEGGLNELLPGEIKAASDLNLFQLMSSTVFVRYKVGIEALDEPACIASYLDIALSGPVYLLARKITGALLLSGSGELASEDKEKTIKKVGSILFGNQWIHQLWTRFYDENGQKRTQNQFTVLSVAYTKTSRGIGFEGHLPWDYSMPTDYQRFLRAACGHWGIMGRLTFEKRARGTENIVLSADPSYQAEDCLVVTSLEAAMLMAAADPQPVIYGGTKVYDAALKGGFVDRILITEIDAELPADAYFPNFDGSPYRLVEDTGMIRDDDSRYPFQFLTYDRIPNTWAKAYSDLAAGE